jgi:penicillin-binding protein 1A
MKLSLYLETTVIGAYLDNGDPFRRDLTIRWFERELSEYRVFSSLLVRRELERLDEPHRTGYLRLLRETEDLELVDEAAILAGLVASPERFSPRRNAEKSLQRRRYVLDQMRVKGFVTPELYS